MSRTTTCDVLVIGAGLEGAEHALRAAAEGKTVIVSDDGNGRTAYWPGVFDVYGPTAAEPPAQLPTRFARGTTTETRRTLNPERRLALLEAKHPTHPFAAYHFEAGRVREAFEARMALLQIRGTLHETPVAVATNAGTIRPADFTCEGIGIVSEVDRFVGLEEWPNWSPEWAAAMVGRPDDVAWVAHQGPVALSSMAIAARWNNPQPSDINALKDAAQGKIALIPPVLGTTFSAATQAREALENAGQPVRELAAAFDSPFGLRLMHHLRHLLDGSTTRLGAVLRTPERGGSRWRAAVNDGGASVNVVADTLVYAHDKFVPPVWAEPWRTSAARWPRNTSDVPWHRHTFQNRTVEVPC